MQVHEAISAAERARCEESLQRDPQFQEDMATPAVRAVVDAVVAEPAMGPHVTVLFSCYLALLTRGYAAATSLQSTMHAGLDMLLPGTYEHGHYWLEVRQWLLVPGMHTWQRHMYCVFNTK